MDPGERTGTLSGAAWTHPATEEFVVVDILLGRMMLESSEDGMEEGEE